MPVVALIEDDPELGQAACDALARAGFQVIRLPDSPHLGETVAQARPDVVLIDLTLPRTSGVEIAQEVHDATGGFIPCIGISSSFLLAETVRKTRLFVAVLDSPFDFNALVLAVTEAVRLDSE